MDKIRNYNIIKQLGEGGMGSVHLAEEELTELKVAIKILHPQLTNNPQFKDRFIREAKALGKLKHPNIIELYSLFEHEGNYCMVMEYAEGKSLKTLISEVGPIHEDRAIKLFLQIAQIVNIANQKSVILWNINPADVIIDSNDNVKIIIGFCKEKSRYVDDDPEKILLYEPIKYQSPEQVKGDNDLDYSSNIYGLGIMFYEMLSGKFPYNAKDENPFTLMREICGSKIKDVRKVYPYISEIIVSILNEMIVKNRLYRCKDLDICINMLRNKARIVNPRTFDKFFLTSTSENDKEWWYNLEINWKIIFLSNYCFHNLGWGINDCDIECFDYQGNVTYDLVLFATSRYDMKLSFFLDQ